MKGSKPSPIRFRPLDGRAETVVEIEVVTPVHGGGVGWDDDERRRHVRRVDPLTPIRPAAIRGQLRFWWRATMGCCLGSLDEMHERESELWGAASKPGRVSLRVDDRSMTATDRRIFESADPKGTGVFNSRSDRGDAGLAYGAFALQPKSGQRTKLDDGVLSQLQGKAQVMLSYPGDREIEVMHALDAWLLFGGIGGRTRRGFGAVDARDRRENVRAFLANFTATATLPRVPSLHGARLNMRSEPHRSAASAHEAALIALRTFRQGENVGRNQRAQVAGNRKPAGRSRWPEPEAIRKITTRSIRAHEGRFVNVDKFPRALFGMPIIFHFQDENAGEPKDTTLEPRDFERMASPLILRPHHDGQSWRGLALVLAVPGIAEVPIVLDRGKNPGATREPEDVESRLTPDEARRIKPLGEYGDALSAFLAQFEKFGQAR